MIRIYLDWNVISLLKLPKYSQLFDFIKANKSSLQFPYSPAHFKDLMKSYCPENALFQTDLDNLEFLSGKHLMMWEKDKTELWFATPKEYFENEKGTEDFLASFDIEKIFSDLDNNDIGLGNIGSLMKSMFEAIPMGININNENSEILQKMFPNLQQDSSFWDLMKDFVPFSKKLLKDKVYYKDFRKTIGDKGFKLDANSGNWGENEVMTNINEFIQKQDPKLTFSEFLNAGFKHQKEPPNLYAYYTRAHLLLDMIGYKADKLQKPTNNMWNIQTDAEHSFYGAHCDYFVAMDNKLLAKTKVLYREFNISTVILTPDEVIEGVGEVIHKVDNSIPFLDDAFSLCQCGEVVERLPTSESNKEEIFAIKLPIFYFNFFNYVIYQPYPEQNGLVLQFKKVNKNYSRFLYYTEVEQVVKDVCGFFGIEDENEFESKKEAFVYKNEDVEFVWRFENGIIKLEKDEDTNRPLLVYIVVASNENSEQS